MITRTRIAATAAVVALAAVLAGCAGGTAPSTSSAAPLGSVETMFGTVDIPQPADGDLTVVALGWSDAETALALERTGKDVGTPILTFRPGQADENSFFGPVIAQIPRGDQALRLWDAVEVIATTSGMAELKRSLRSKPIFD